MICSRDYISPLVLIHTLQGCIPPAVICSPYYISPQGVYTPVEYV